jgi:glucose-1-phosphate adenylyltransferase
VPRFVDRGRTVVHALPGYWRDVGQPHHYLAAHQDVLTDEQGLFGDPDWPVLTRQPPREPAHVHAGAVVEDSLLSPGSHVRGEVRRSVVGPGVRIEPGALVTDSVLFAETVVEEGARVHWAIVDERCVVGRGAVVGDPAAEGREDPEQVTIVGRDSVVRTDLDRGARLEPGTTA